MSQFNIIVWFVVVVSLGILCYPNSFPSQLVGLMDYLDIKQPDFFWKQELVVQCESSAVFYGSIIPAESTGKKNKHAKE